MPWLRPTDGVVWLQKARCLIPSETRGVCQAPIRPECQRAGAVVMSEPRGGAMSDEPTTEQVTRALADNLPEWRRHQRCPEGARCRAEYGEWMDVLLEELADAVGQRPTQH